jgi:hypothetical protein
MSNSNLSVFKKAIDSSIKNNLPLTISHWFDTDECAWEELNDDPYTIYLYQCSVTIPFGPFKKGDKVDIAVGYEEGIIELYNCDSKDIIYTGKLLIGFYPNENEQD